MRVVRSGPPLAHPGAGRVAVPAGLPRLLSGLRPDGRSLTIDEHVARWGELPHRRGAAFLDELERSGVRGHGGAWFPVAAKWRAVGRNTLRSPVVVANGAEGEPASGKDRLLLQQLPHLVLDGAVTAALTIGAKQVIVYIHPGAVADLRQAIADRGRLGREPVSIEVVVAPDRFLAGQESAAVNTIVGRAPATPTFVGLRTVRDQGVGGRPTLVQNVETLAHVALIARFGADWFRQLGSVGSTGSVLLTVTGRWPEVRIVEAALATPLADVLGIGPDHASSIQGVLLGGYGGGWLSGAEAMSMPLTEEAARERGSSLGAGVVALLPTGVCPLSEISRVVSYMEGQGAGQCGPCVNGLAHLALALRQLAHQPNRLRGGVSSIPALCDLIEGRGACRHPDGVARFVRTGLRVFADHAAAHVQRGPCPANGPILPVPQSDPRPRSVRLR